ncbi:MAG TPA: GAF domain-containing SpoIIE family protein phosphatase [Acidobacteriaceae bacterium]|jgi:sigma-B regulation protein RsbU (phosphoserine phosphatase)
MPAVLIDLPGYHEDARNRAPALVTPRLNLPMTSKTATRFLYLAFGLFIIASMTYYVMTTAALFQELMHRSEHARMPFQVDDDLLTLKDLQGEAIAAGLRNGDRLLEMRGEHFYGHEQIVATEGGGKDFLRPGETLRVLVRRIDGTVHRAFIHAVPRGPSPAHSNPEWMIRLLFAAPPLICLLIGYWVAAARIRDPNAWLLLLLFAAPSAISDTQNWWPGMWVVWLGAWYNLLQYLMVPALFLFGIYFPERWRADRRYPWAKWLILAPLSACFLMLCAIFAIQNYAAPEMGHWSARASIWFNRIVDPLNLACVVLYVVAVLDKLRSATTADVRRRMQVLAFGSIVGLGSLLLVFVLLPHFGIAPNKHLWITLPGYLLFFAAPFSFAYVVVVQRALDVRILLRMGTKYALARYSLLVAEFAVVGFILIRFVVPLVRHKENLPVTIPVLILVAAVLIKLFTSHDSISSRLQRWLDRKFFREAYDAELVLSELSDQARRFTEARPLVDTVTRRISEVLHVSSIAVYLRQGHSFGLEHCIGGADDVPKRFEESSSTVRNLARSNQPATLYRENPDGWFLLADDRERRALDTLRAELLLPLAGRDKLLGFISLGPKRSEEPYTPSDLRLLQSVSTQAGLALEISALVHSLASEAARRERIDREIEIAREVQERLFPQQLPTLPGHSIHGACRPAQGVGGDYYDVLSLDDGSLGLAIGDVSGKGISAALLMASLRASLRGMTMDGPADLAVLMSRVNRLVYESSATNRYATFFFSIYEPAPRLLRYVNAGHNPPYVLRNSEVHALDGGGPVIGLLPDAIYEECRLLLEPGDLLLAYTDGISEALNLQEQEWGEERMLAAARARLPENASTILRHIVTEADRFAATAPQHDDMTLLLMKLDHAPRLASA